MNNTPKTFNIGRTPQGELIKIVEGTSIIIGESNIPLEHVSHKLYQKLIQEYKVPEFKLKNFGIEPKKTGLDQIVEAESPKTHQPEQKELMPPRYGPKVLALVGSDNDYDIQIINCLQEKFQDKIEGFEIIMGTERESCISTYKKNPDSYFMILLTKTITEAINDMTDLTLIGLMGANKGKTYLLVNGADAKKGAEKLWNTYGFVSGTEDQVNVIQHERKINMQEDERKAEINDLLNTLELTLKGMPGSPLYQR